MKHLWLGALIAGALALASCTQGGQTVAAAPKAEAAPAAAVENVPAVIAGLEHDWAKAIVGKDTATIERLLADDFTGTTNDVRYDKADALGDVTTGNHESLDLTDIAVHTYGNAAVATMNQNEKSQHGKEAFSGHYLFTNVWVKQDGQWRAVASHGSRIR